MGADITRGRQQQGADHHLVQELRFDDARFAANCDWSFAKKTPDVVRFFPDSFKKNFNFFLRSVREKKTQRETFKKTPGAFSQNALLHRNTM